jgi:hypothetical protein
LDHGELLRLIAEIAVALTGFVILLFPFDSVVDEVD